MRIERRGSLAFSNRLSNTKDSVADGFDAQSGVQGVLEDGDVQLIGLNIGNPNISRSHP